MRYKNLIKKAFLILILVALILCLYACSKNDKPNSESVSSTTQSENETKMVFATRATKATSGTCGDTATWDYDIVNRTLTIRGTGMIEKQWEQWEAAIKKVVIQEGITELCDRAFTNCTELTEITIPNTVDKIGDSVFQNTGLYNNDSNWENGMLYIDNCLVDTNENANGNIEITEGTRIIASYVFSGSFSIRSVKIPDSVIRIGQEFLSYSSVTDITVSEGNQYFSSVDGVLFNKDKTEMLLYPDFKSETVYSVPNNVKIIRYNAIRFAYNLEKIFVGKNVEVIENANFYGDCDGDGYLAQYEIYYEGTETEWNRIVFSNKFIDSTKLYFNSSKFSETTTSASINAITTEKKEDKKNNLFDWF